MDLQDLRELSAYTLANLASVTTPDTLTSPGATFLTGVRDALEEAIAWHTDHDHMTPTEALADLRDEHHDITDGAVPIYTHQRWQTFTDLAAYTEDPSEIGDTDGRDMTDLAGMALYLIADRLITALLDGLQEWADDMATTDQS